ncbi:MAG: DNA-3-methyladenine glycosylase 2 family protein, partial [Bacteroidota bacterium]
WTVDMILLYTLERPNVFPAQDYHLRLVMEQLYNIGPKRITAEMKKVAKNWAPYQSFGVKYLLAWKEANKSRKL